MKENNKGITLLVLSITVLIIIIIASTATYYSISAYNNAKLTKFETELKIMQAQVELWEKEGKTGIGLTRENIPTNAQNILSNFQNSIGANNIDKYEYLSNEKIKELGIDGISNSFLVVIQLPELTPENTNEISNIIKKYRVISVEGLKYKGNTYHTLAQLEEAGLLSGTYSIFGSTKAVASLTDKETGKVTVFSSVQDAVDAAGSNPSIVTLLKDEIDETITIGVNSKTNLPVMQNIILDTNGKILTSSSANTIENLGTLTIEGEGTIENTIIQEKIQNETNSDSRCVISNSGIINIYEAKICGKTIEINHSSNESVNIYSGQIIGINHSSNGSVNIYSGQIISNSGYAILADNTSSESTINVFGGEITGTRAIHQNTPGNIKISGGTLYAKRDDDLTFGVSHFSSGTIDITGGKISAINDKNYGARGVEMRNTTLNISGGIIFVQSITGGAYGIAENDKSGNITITGGNIETMCEKGNSKGIFLTGKLDDNDNIITYNNTTVTISGNTKIVTNSDTGISYGIENKSSIGDITINDVTITATSKEGNSYGIYNSVASNTTTLIKGTVIGNTNGVYNKGTLNINGGTIISDKHGIYNDSKGKIKFTNGEIISSGTTGIENRSISDETVVMESGTIKVYSKDNILKDSDVYGIRNFGGDITVKGGTIKVKSVGHHNGISNYNGDIIFEGGKIEVIDRDNTNESSAKGILTRAGTVSMDGGTIISYSENSMSAGIFNQNRGENYTAVINITGGDIESSSSKGNSYGVYVYEFVQEPPTGTPLTTVTVSGNTTIKSISTTGRAYGISNLISKGNITISGGTIEADSTSDISYGIYNTMSNVVTIGNNDGNVTTLSPLIIGKKNGVFVSNTGTFNFYDGIIKGGLYTSTNKGAIDATIADKPDGYGVYYLTKDNCEVATLKQGLILNYDSAGYTSASTSTSWKDRSENGNTGTLKSGTTTSAFGWTDNGLVFDSTDDWVNTGIKDTTAITNRTYAVTFKVPTVKAYSYLIGNWEGGGAGIGIDDNSYLSTIAYIGGDYRYISTNVVPNTIYNTIMTYDGVNLKFYVNGKEIESSLILEDNIKLPTDSTVVALGTNPKGEAPNGCMFNGTIYSAYVFDKALTGEEVTELYNSEKAKGR